jgi:hypothetical protein
VSGSTAREPQLGGLQPRSAVGSEIGAPFGYGRPRSGRFIVTIAIAGVAMKQHESGN